MAKVCIICNKKPVKGNLVSHAKNKTKRWIYPNLQKLRIILNNKHQRAWVCTNCIKSGKVVKVS